MAEKAISVNDKVAVEIKIDEEVMETGNNILGYAQKAVRAGIGAAALVQDEVVRLFEKAQEEAKKAQNETTNLIERAVERGEKVETDSRKMVEDSRAKISEVVETRRKQVKKSADEATETLDDRIESVLHGMNVPSKNDIDALNRKLTTLTRKVNDLAKELKKAEAPKTTTTKKAAPKKAAVK